MFKVSGSVTLLKTMSYTGTAAANVNGSTMSSLLKDNRKNGHNLTLNMSSVNSLQTELRNVQFLVFDEVSMLSTFNMCKLDARCKQAKNSPHPFGGVHMIFLGDFIQYPPIGGAPLYRLIRVREEDDDKEEEDHQTKRLLQEQNHTSGRNLWLMVNFVVFLTEQMRQDDEEYLSTLTFLRNSDTTTIDSHYNRLKSRVFGPNNPTLSIDDFWDAPVLTTRNSVRSAVNFAKTKAWGVHLKHKQIVILATDTVAKSADPLTPVLRNLFLNKIDNDTADLLGMLPLVPGMPLLLKKNLATELKICNGTHCRLSRVVLHEDEPHFDTHSESGSPHFLTKYPSVIIVWIDDPKFAPFPGLHPNEFPIFPHEDTWVYKYFDSNGTRKTQNIQRKQFPLLPRFALTGYCAQGGTFPKALVDLTLPIGKGTGRNLEADPYVLLSRLKNLKGLGILRTFPKSVLIPKHHPELIKELQRLQTISTH
jgi:hypothetical protein